MASLVLGLAGAGIGNMIGGTFLGMSAASIGWSVGSTLGSLLFQDKGQTQYGPRLGDLKVQASTYGASIPRVYGTTRVAGNLIWSLPIRETVHEEDVGGKGGGPSATAVTYTYSQTFAVGLCEGEIVGVRKIWANGELIYNAGDDATVETLVASNRQATNIAFYTGSETQTPNSLIQADVGADDTPAYRGLAYVVFNNLQLAKFGNRTPNLEFEVVGLGTSGEWVTHIATPGTTELNPVTEYLNGLLYVGMRPGDNARSYRETVYDLSGNIVVPETTYTTTAVGSDIAELACRNWRALYYASPLEWRNTLTGESVAVSGAPSWLGTLLNADNKAFIKLPVNAMALIAAHDNVVSLLRYPYETGSGVPATRHDLEKTLFAYTSIADCGCYADVFDGVSLYYLFKLDAATDFTLNQYDVDGNLLDYWTIPAGFSIVNKASFKVEDGIFYTLKSPAYAYRLNDDHTVTQMDTSAHGYDPYPCAIGVPAVYWTAKWVFRLGPPLTSSGVGVQDIVEAECALAGLSGSQIDAAGLAADTLHGYVIADRGPLRASLEPLMRAFYFDVAEIDAALEFVKRGGAVAADLDEDDLAAHPYGATEPDAVLLERTQDVELPDEVAVNYMDSAAAYQVGTQYGRRLIGASRSQQSVSLPMALTAAKAREVADVLLYDAWQGRVQFTLAVSNKHTRLTPTDVIRFVKSGRQYTSRLLSRDEDSGVIKFVAAFEDLQVYDQSAPAASLPAPSEDVAATAATRLALLDIPLLRDVDDGVGIYTAACGYIAGWPGCQIFKSSDAGASWLGFGRAILNDSVIGFATTALGDFQQNIFDEHSSVTVRLLSGTLASASEANVLNGANAAMLGDELIQFKTATLISTNTWTLSGLLRGRKGTEWARSTHVMGERFVLLDAATTYVQSVPIADLNILRHYRGVSFGSLIDTAEETRFTYQGVSSKPLSPVLLGGGRDAAGNLTINWVRRSRIAGEWTDYADVPLGEESEEYEVEIWDSSYATLARTITGLAAATTSYTAAQQTSDFGAPQSTVYVRVYQISASVGRGTKLEGTL